MFPDVVFSRLNMNKEHFMLLLFSALQMLLSFSTLQIISTDVRLQYQSVGAAVGSLLFGYRIIWIV